MVFVFDRPKLHGPVHNINTVHTPGELNQDQRNFLLTGKASPPVFQTTLS